MGKYIKQAIAIMLLSSILTVMLLIVLFTERGKIYAMNIVLDRSIDTNKMVFNVFEIIVLILIGDVISYLVLVSFLNWLL